MPLIELHVSLEVAAPQCRPEVRAWIDPNPEAGLEGELELPLRRVNGGAWVGAFAIGATHPQRFLYRLGLAAHAGADWSLCIRQRGLKQDILTDRDTLDIAKCWLVGSCNVPAAWHASTQADKAQVTRMPRSCAPSASAHESQPRVVSLDSYRSRR
jgi:hypothetical protein